MKEIKILKIISNECKFCKLKDKCIEKKCVLYKIEKILTEEK